MTPSSTPRAIARLEAHLLAHPGAAAAGPRLLHDNGSTQRSVYPFLTPLRFLVWVTLLGLVADRLARGRAPADGRVDWVKGAAVAYRREPFLAVGGFDELFFLYFEEQELCYRLRQAGWEVHYVPAATVVHSGEASVRQQRAQATRQFFRSAVTFYEMHHTSEVTHKVGTSNGDTAAWVPVQVQPPGTSHHQDLTRFSTSHFANPS